MSQSQRIFSLSVRFSSMRRLLVASALMLGFSVPAARAQVQERGRSSASQLIYEGFTEPKYDIMVAATEIGRLETMLVKVGDEVTAGQVVGQLEDTLQRSSIRIAELQSNMQGELEASRAEVDLRRSRAELLRQLATDRMARPDELARAETDLRIAKAKLLNIEEQLKLRQLELERYQLQLERRFVRIPMDGVISEVFHEAGEYITPADPAVVRLLVLHKLYGVFNIPVEETNLIRIGTPARVFLRSSSKTIDAKVSSISPAIDGESGTVQLRVELDNTKRELLVGDRCTLRLMPTAMRSANKLRGATHQ